MTQALVRIAAVGLLYATIGTVVTIGMYVLLQVTGLVPTPPRSVDGMVAFFDKLLLTAVALGLAGLVMGGLLSRGRSTIICIVWSMIVAALLAALLQPPMTAIVGHVASVAVGALVMGALASMFRGLRSAPTNRQMGM